MKAKKLHFGKRMRDYSGGKQVFSKHNKNCIYLGGTLSVSVF